MTVDEFEDRVARLEEHLVSRTAEEELKEAERLFAEQGNTAWARCALLRAQLAHRRERVSGEFWREEEDDA